MRQSHVLVVEDEPVTRAKVAGFLRDDGFQVTEAASAAEARAAIARGVPDAVVLDVNLPDGNGFELTRELRSRSDVGIILVTQRHEETDRIVGLELGSDGYMVKPVNPRELAVRIRNLIRRVAGSRAAEADTGRTIAFAGWSLDFGSRALTGPDGATVPLTRGEHEILAALARNAGRPLTREQIVDLSDCAARDPMSQRSVDVIVARLRRKIEADPRVPRVIMTVHGVGYRLVT